MAKFPQDFYSKEQVASDKGDIVTFWRAQTKHPIDCQVCPHIDSGLELMPSQHLYMWQVASPIEVMFSEILFSLRNPEDAWLLCRP